MMREKERKKILNDLNNIVQDKLKNNFKNRKHRLVVKIESVQIANYEVNLDENDRDKACVSNIQIHARVYVDIGFQASTSDNIVLKNQKPINFIYNKEIDNFELNDEAVEFYDATPN